MIIYINFISNIKSIISNIQDFGYLQNFYFDTLILKTDEDKNKFFEVIDLKEKISNMNLLFRLSNDELNYLGIVNKINNNKSNLLFLYQTENYRIFGTFIKTKLVITDMDGTSQQNYRDENAFAFSLNQNKKYKILVPDYAFVIDRYNFIRIGNNYVSNGFYFCGKLINDENLITNNIYDFSENSELTKGNGKLIEFEIFELNLNNEFLNLGKYKLILKLNL